MGDYQCTDQDGTVLAKFVFQHLKPRKLGKVDLQSAAWESGELGVLEIIAMVLGVVETGRKQEREAVQRGIQNRR